MSKIKMTKNKLNLTLPPSTDPIDSLAQAPYESPTSFTTK